MTNFEEMLLGRIDGMTSEIGKLTVAVTRLEERQIHQDDRLEELERTPPPGSGAGAAPRSRWCMTKDVGVTGAALVALATALFQALGTHAPVPPSAPRAPTTIEATR